jgi:hypothetical protein
VIIAGVDVPVKAEVCLAPAGRSTQQDSKP